MKIRIDVEGIMGPYYLKQRIRTRVKESNDETRKLVDIVIPRYIPIVYMVYFQYGDIVRQTFWWLWCWRGLRLRFSSWAAR